MDIRYNRHWKDKTWTNIACSVVHAKRLDMEYSSIWCCRDIFVERETYPVVHWEVLWSSPFPDRWKSILDRWWSLFLNGRGWTIVGNSAMDKQTDDSTSPTHWYRRLPADLKTFVDGISYLKKKSQAKCTKGKEKAAIWLVFFVQMLIFVVRTWNHISNVWMDVVHSGRNWPHQRHRKRVTGTFPSGS